MSDEESFYEKYVLQIWYLVGLSLTAPTGLAIAATRDINSLLVVVTFILLAVPVGLFAHTIMGFVWLILSFFVDSVRDKDLSSLGAALWLLAGLLMFLGVF